MESGDTSDIRSKALTQFQQAEQSQNASQQAISRFLDYLKTPVGVQCLEDHPDLKAAIDNGQFASAQKFLTTNTGCNELCLDLQAGDSEDALSLVTDLLTKVDPQSQKPSNFFSIFKDFQTEFSAIHEIFDVYHTLADTLGGYEKTLAALYKDLDQDPGHITDNERALLSTIQKDSDNTQELSAELNVLRGQHDHDAKYSALFQNIDANSTLFQAYKILFQQQGPVAVHNLLIDFATNNYEKTKEDTTRLYLGQSGPNPDPAHPQFSITTASEIDFPQTFALPDEVKQYAQLQSNLQQLITQLDGVYTEFRSGDIATIQADLASYKLQDILTNSDNVCSSAADQLEILLHCPEVIKKYPQLEENKNYVMADIQQLRSLVAVDVTKPLGKLLDVDIPNFQSAKSDKDRKAYLLDLKHDMTNFLSPLVSIRARLYRDYDVKNDIWDASNPFENILYDAYQKFDRASYHAITVYDITSRKYEGGPLPTQIEGLKVAMQSLFSDAEPQDNVEKQLTDIINELQDAEEMLLEADPNDPQLVQFLKDHPLANLQSIHEALSGAIYAKEHVWPDLKSTMEQVIQNPTANGVQQAYNDMLYASFALQDAEKGLKFAYIMVRPPQKN